MLSVDSVNETSFKSAKKKLSSIIKSSNYINEKQLSAVAKLYTGLVDSLGLLLDDDYIDNGRKLIDLRFISTLAQRISRHLSKTTGHKETLAQKLWCLTLVSAAALAKNDYTVYWNGLLRKLGYKAVIDYTGLGFIHPNEPSQAVFLVSDAYKQIDTVLNKDYKNEKADLPNRLHMFVDTNGDIINLPTYEYYVSINKDVTKLRGKEINLIKYSNLKYLVIGKGSKLQSVNKEPILHDFLFCGKWAKKVHFVHCTIQSDVEGKSPEKATQYYGTIVDNCQLTDCFIEIGSYSDCKLEKCTIDYGRFYNCVFKDCNTQLDKNNSLLFKQCKWL